VFLHFHKNFKLHRGVDAVEGISRLRLKNAVGISGACCMGSKDL
jgi:hypothetical protein